MSETPSTMAERFKAACISILVGAIGVYCAVALIQAIWPVLAVILGIAGVVGLIVGGIVLYRKIRGQW